MSFAYLSFEGTKNPAEIKLSFVDQKEEDEILSLSSFPALGEGYPSVDRMTFLLAGLEETQVAEWHYLGGERKPELARAPRRN
ncbi:hypothetical protein EJB05_53200, partial [Eragrostis curvula]